MKRWIILMLTTGSTALAGWHDAPVVPIEIGRLDSGSGVGTVVSTPHTATYVVVFHLQPGERIVEARGVVHDGWSTDAAAGKRRREIARILGGLGYRLAMNEAPAGLRDTVGPLAAFLLGNKLEPAPAPSGVRRLLLRRKDLHHRDAHAAAVLVLDANLLTRVEFRKIAIRRTAGSGKSRARAEPSLVHAGTELSRADLLQVLAGPPHETRHGGVGRSGDGMARPVEVDRPSVLTRQWAP